MDDGWPDLRRVDWPDQYPRLLLMAEGRIRRLAWPRGKPQARDFVQRAILKALSGQRTYHSKKTLFENLCQIISSDISHEIESYDTQKVGFDDATIINIKDYRVESPDDATYYREMVSRYFDFLGSQDAAARNIADLMINRCITSSCELAVQLGLSVREIESGKKRLRRLTVIFCQRNEEVA